MNMKINTICFILLFFALITAASATDSDNETLKTINQPDYDQDIDSEGKLQMNTHSDEVLSKSVENDNVVSSSEKTVLASKATYHSITPVKANVKVNMKAPNVKMHYKDGTKFKVTLKDNKKKAMKNTKIKITIDETTYSKKTDSKGVATLALNLKSGTYKVVSTYAGSSQFAKKSVNSKVTIKSTIKCSDFTKYYKNTASYYSTFYDKKGKLLKNTVDTAKTQLQSRFDVVMLYTLAKSSAGEKLHNYSYLFSIGSYVTIGLVIVLLVIMIIIDRHHPRDYPYWVGLIMVVSSGFWLIPAVYLKATEYFQTFFVRNEYIHKAVTGMFEISLDRIIRTQLILFIVGVVLILSTLVIHYVYLHHLRVQYHKSHDHN